MGSFTVHLQEHAGRVWVVIQASVITVLTSLIVLVDHLMIVNLRKSVLLPRAFGLIGTSCCGIIALLPLMRWWTLAYGF